MKKQENKSLEKENNKVFLIVIRERALKQLRSVPRKFAEKIDILIQSLARDPYPTGCKKLQGYENIYRVRYADYRVVYMVGNNKLIVEIIQIGDRKDIYKKL